ncbi:MAG: hypothetical protein ACTJLK_00850 [Anaplasma sp.]
MLLGHTKSAAAETKHDDELGFAGTEKFEQAKAKRKLRFKGTKD